MMKGDHLGELNHNLTLSAQSSTGDGDHQELPRELGFVSALAIGVGTMIAAGIFTLSGLAVQQVGSGAMISFIIAACVALFTALSYCEFSSLYPTSGEGYLYAHKSLTPTLAWVVGFSLLLGYTASCAFYLSSLSEYVQEFIYHVSWRPIFGLIALSLLTLLNLKGSKESSTFQIVVTAAKVILLIWFVAGGLSELNIEQITTRLETDMIKLTSTAAMVFITFFGFSAIAASAGEIQSPTSTIPRAIFWSMGSVSVLYIAVILVVIVANLKTYDEHAMGFAAELFLGPIGQKVIVGGAIFSMLSAANASVMAGSRVIFAMSQRHHLPQGLSQVSISRRTPVNAVLLTGILIGGFSLIFNLEDLAHYADAVLLVALSMVNLALIVHRRRYPTLDRPFRVPLVPLLPILGIVANLYLIVIQLREHPIPFTAGLSTLLVGWALFIMITPKRTPAQV
jgi:amino acid transporter